MRARMLFGWLALALICASGCETTRTQIKPPIPVDEVRDPPQNDPRYSNAPSFPKGTLNKDTGMRREIVEAGGPMGPGAPDRPLSGPGQGR